MKNEICLSVPSPCAEKWEHFTPTLKGAFCSSCSKNVIDFTKMSEEEIFLFFNKRTTPVCGRFRPGQLRTYSQKEPVPVKPGLNWLQAGFLSLLLVLVSKQGSAQNELAKEPVELVPFQDHHDGKEIPFKALHIIKGVVKDEYNEPLPGVSIYLKGSNEGTHTNIEGEFRFPKELAAGDVLVFNFIGYETREYVVPKNVPEVLEISLILSIEFLGEVLVDTVYSAKKSAPKRWWHKLKGLF